jgi:hypothetical protein
LDRLASFDALELPVSKTKTTVEVRTKVEADVALRRADLTAQEEQVLRMRYGIAIDASAPLEMRGDDHAEARIQLEAMTRRALGAVQAEVDTDRRDAIIERLRRM